MQTPSITLRPATDADAALLAEFGRRTFAAAFAGNNDPVQMARYMAQTYGVEQQSAELSDPQAFTLMAEVEGETAGYARLRVHTEPGITGDNPIEIHRFYVDQRWHGRGVAAALMQACLAEALQRRHDVVWLGVWEHNPRARAFYRKWGFEEVGTHVFLLGEEAQTDLMMARPLGKERR
jgi:ribosomal protein S18 acetylase RimI-like enzyme